MMNVKKETAAVKNEKVWTPNENQKAFLEVLKDYEAPVTLMEISVDKGVRFASGVVTPLVKRGLVTSEEVNLVYDVMFKGAKVGEKRSTVKAYSLAKVEKAN